MVRDSGMAWGVAWVRLRGFVSQWSVAAGLLAKDAGRHRGGQAKGENAEIDSTGSEELAWWAQAFWQRRSEEGSEKAEAGARRVEGESRQGGDSKRHI